MAVIDADGSGEIDLQVRSRRLTAATTPMENPYCSCKLTRSAASQEFTGWFVGLDDKKDGAGLHSMDYPRTRWP